MEPLFPLCKRALIPGPSINEHHLIPKTCGGKETIKLHRICHNKIHSLFSEKELALKYNTIEKLLTNEEIIKFIRWLKNKPLDFNAHNDKINNRKR